MKARFHIAVISFCADLVSPEAEAVPAGLLVVGELEDRGFAMLQTDQSPELPELPAYMAALVSDFQQLLRAQLEDLLSQDALRQDLDALMDAFEESLRNSFYISHLERGVEIELPDPAPARVWQHVAPRAADAFERPWALQGWYRPIDQPRRARA